MGLFPNFSIISNINQLFSESVKLKHEVSRSVVLT